MLKNAHTTTSLFIYCSVCIFWIINASTAAQNYRLPKSIVPEHYTLNINTYLDNEFKFNGYVVIKVRKEPYFFYLRKMRDIVHSPTFFGQIYCIEYGN